MLRTPLLLFGAVIGLAVSPARASDLGAESTGSVTITVVIPPFAAGLAAQAEGAVGLWTVSTEGPALMLKLPSVVTADQASDAVVFTGGSNVVEVAAIEPEPMQVVRTGSRNENGLLRQTLSLRPTEVALGGHVDPVTMLIRSI